jgi:peptide/nickel transport system substrate-binding protein
MGAAVAAGLAVPSWLGTGRAAASVLDASSSGGTLTMGIASPPDTLDPGATGLALTLLITFSMFDPLVWWLPTATGSQFHPGLATSYTVSPDATTYTFKLRKDVTFHDGTKFDATAVKATYDHIVDPATKSKSGIGALGPYKETVIIDPYTVQIVFTAPNAGFLHQQAAGNFGIDSPAALAKYGATGFGNHPVGTGPFVFSEYVSGDHLTVVKNPKYTWGPPALGNAGPAYLDELVFRIITDASGLYDGLQTGQVQIAMNLPPNDIYAAQQAKTYQTLTVPSIGTPDGLPINVTKPPTDELAVRQAMLYAVDQEAMTKEVLFGTSNPAYSVLTPVTPGYSAKSASLYDYDPDKAEALLEGAGWTKGSGGVRSKGGQQLHLDIVLFSDAGFELPTQFVTSEWSKVGFSSTTTVQPFADDEVTMNAGTANVGSFGYFGEDPYLLNIWVNSNQIKSGFNWEHYSNAAMNSAIATANATADAATRNADYEAICMTLMEAAVYLPLWETTGQFTLSSKVSGLKTTLNGYILFNGAKLS